MSTDGMSHASKESKRNYFGKEMLALKIFGLSLTGNEGRAYKIYSFLILSTTVFTYPLLDFYEYFKHDISVVADIIVYQTASFLALCKTAVVLRNRIKFGKLLAKLEQAPFIPNADRGGPIEEELAQECVWMTTAQTFTYWTFASLTIIATIVYTLAKRLRSSDYHEWQLPYGPFTMLNVTYSPSYEISLFYQSVSIIYISSLFIAIDLLLAAVLAHISYQFKILQNYFRRLVEACHWEMVKDTNDFKHKSSNNPALNDEIDVSTIPWKYLKKSIIDAVEYHLEIIAIANEIEEVFSYLLLLVFLGTLALLCFSVYAASSAGYNLQMVVKHAGEGICSCLQVATVCYWGEQVVQESQLVGRAVYELNFVGTDLRFQKILVFIVRRSQSPIKLTAGKFADICLNTFAWILRTSYSTFMILRRTNT